MGYKSEHGAEPYDGRHFARRDEDRDPPESGPAEDRSQPREPAPQPRTRARYDSDAHYQLERPGQERREAEWRRRPPNDRGASGQGRWDPARHVRSSQEHERWGSRGGTERGADDTADGACAWRGGDQERRFGASRERRREDDAPDWSGQSGREDEGRYFGSHFGGPNGWTGQVRDGQSGYGGLGGWDSGRDGDHGVRGAQPYPGSYGGRGYEETSYGGDAFAEPNRYGGRDSGWSDDRHRYGDGELGHAGQSHRGRGPQSYRRSDERIREEICDRLTDDHYIDATHIEVRVESGEVTLCGSVNHRDAKRRSEDLAESVMGVHDVRNELRVQRDDRGTSRRFGEHGGQSVEQACVDSSTVGQAPSAPVDEAAANGGPSGKTR